MNHERYTYQEKWIKNRCFVFRFCFSCENRIRLVIALRFLAIKKINFLGNENKKRKFALREKHDFYEENKLVK